jgi:hypothetical protein
LSRWSWFFSALVILSVLDYLVWADGEVSDGSQSLLLLAMIVVAIAGSAAATALARQARTRRARRATSSSAVQLLALFAVMTLLGGLAAAGGTLASPRVRAAAVLLKSPARVIGGIYLGTTSDHVYLGEAVRQADARDLGDHQQGDLIEFGRRDVARLVVGTSQPFDDALGDIARMCAQAVRSLAAPTGTVDTTHCDIAAPPAPKVLSAVLSHDRRTVTLCVQAAGATRVTVSVDHARARTRLTRGQARTPVSAPVREPDPHPSYAATVTATDSAGNTSAGSTKKATGRRRTPSCGAD